jgi:hypothetical protein
VAAQVLAASVDFVDDVALPHTGEVDGHRVSFDLSVA